MQTSACFNAVSSSRLAAILIDSIYNVVVAQLFVVAVVHYLPWRQDGCCLKFYFQLIETDFYRVSSENGDKERC